MSIPYTDHFQAEKEKLCPGAAKGDSHENGQACQHWVHQGSDLSKLAHEYGIR